MDFVKEWEKFNLADQPLLVAVSTGVDSMVLLDLLMKLPPKMQPQITVAYVDHQLREQSKVETKFIKKFCQQNNLPLEVAVWSKEQHPQNGTEEAARKFRYQFFLSVMKKRKIKVLATAHHADDLAETVIMKLVRGGELSQLVGIESRRSFEGDYQIIRPLLRYSKKQLYEYADQKELTYFEDETNYQDDVLRNRIRHNIIPRLKQENPRFLDHVLSFSKQLRAAVRLGETIVKQRLIEILENDKVNLEKWRNLDDEERQATLKKLIIQYGLPIKDKQFSEMNAFLLNRQKPQGMLQVSASVNLIKEYDYFYFGQIDNSIKISEERIGLKPNKKIVTDDFEIQVSESNHAPAADEVLRFTALPRGLELRHRKAGDWLRVDQHSKKLRRFFIDRKISQKMRQTGWVIADQKQEIFAVFGNEPHSTIYLSQPAENATIRYIVAIKYRKR